jgi:NhaA family Na+:H+ antiporter
LVAVFGSRVPPRLKVFLLTLAIVDDIGAILVIAAFYSGPISTKWLLAAAGLVALVWLLREVRVRYLVAYVVLGGALWFCIYRSGVHATIAGVIMGLLTPALPFLSTDQAEVIVDELEDRRDLTAAEVRRVSFLISESVPATDRLINALHPWTSYVIVPIFALANAGIELGGDSLALGSQVTLGIIAGLVLGKTLGITAFSWLAVRMGWGSLPAGVRWSQMVGLAAVAGIGFTVSLFVADLAFDGTALLADAKVGILIASLLAAAIGSAILVATAGDSAVADLVAEADDAAAQPEPVAEAPA